MGFASASGPACAGRLRGRGRAASGAWRAKGAEEATPRELDRRLRAATGFLQSVDLEIGRLLKQVLDRRHGGLIGISGEAPDGLVFEMGVGRFASGDYFLP